MKPVSQAVPSILVVDDDFDIRSTVKEILSDEGYEVQTAMHGAEALTLLNNGAKPSLILLDLMMPVMDGFAFCASWRADPALHKIPVVIISADASTKQQAAVCGATSFLNKPIQLTDLMAVAAKYTRSA